MRRAGVLKTNEELGFDDENVRREAKDDIKRVVRQLEKSAEWQSVPSWSVPTEELILPAAAANTIDLSRPRSQDSPYLFVSDHGHTSNQETERRAREKGTGLTPHDGKRICWSRAGQPHREGWWVLCD